VSAQRTTGNGVTQLCARTAALVLLVACTLLATIGTASALTPIEVTPDQERIDITTVGEAYEGRRDNLQVETAPGVDGATGRMSVRAATAGTNPNWIVFALRNSTDKPIERWVTAERYNAVGSGVVWPDLDARRIEAVTPSVGFLPDRVKSDRADIFRLTIEPGQTITYVVELATDRFSRIYLWKALEYEQKSRDRQLFNGILLGITGLLAVFLTAVFAANHKVIFPAAALVTWCALALLCVDFGFWHKLFQMRPEDNAQYRAAAEAAVAASLVIFLFTFLRVTLWHGFVRMLFLVWIAAQLAIIATAILDPRLAATVARMSMVGIGVIGGGLTLFLSLRGLDRALALAPTWILFAVWLFGAGLTLTGRLSGEIPVAGLLAGLVFIVLLIGFTVTQFAFRSAEPAYGASPTEQQLRSAAVESTGVAVWEWTARRNEIRVDPVVEATLGLKGGVLSSKLEDFLTYVHPGDKDRFEFMLLSVKENDGGDLKLHFRMRHEDSSYRWFDLEGATVRTSDRRSLRCIGLLRDVTDEKRAQERLMHDAVHDSLTGLPNRGLFLDRLGVALVRAKDDPSVRPTLIYCDLDKFKSVNSSFGLIVGDSLLLTVSRRLARALQPQDTLARIGGDQFGILIPAAQDPREIARFAEHVRHSLRAPIRIAGQEIVLTSSIGVAVYDGSEENAQDLLREAETAMSRAKRSGSDRVEIFKPEMRADRDQRIAIESELRRAIEQRQLDIAYQPIIALSNEELVGFEALVRWEHPRLGTLAPAEFIPVAEETDLIVRLGSYVLGRAVADIARWQKELPRPDDPLFMSVNISSRQLMTPDLIQEVRHVVGRNVLARGTLRLEITESLVMENPEQATHILAQLKDAGAGLALDDFGTGYSSLSYLDRFPFDVIKIDRSLVQASSGDAAGSPIIRSVVALSHELGKRVVAEGIESGEHAAFLRSIGCEMAQGYYYGEPMPERDVLHLLRLIRKADRRMRRRGLVRARRKSAEEAVIETPAHAANGHTPPEARTGRPTGAPPRPTGANGHELPMPNVVQRNQPVQRPPLRTGPPTQPVMRAAAAEEKTRQGRLRSAAASARARIAGLTGATAFEPARPKVEEGGPLLKDLPPTPLRRDGQPANGQAQPRTARTEPVTQTGANGSHGANGRPPPLPHEVASAVRRPPAQATDRPPRPPPRVRTQPVDLDVLPPQIKASLEKLAGGLNRNPPPSGGPPKSDSTASRNRKRT
jgi:diguanylate cyclase (GGDEF)-like protein/PAS domain S-box-containing protein